jgi:hypothetical protein
VTFRDPGDQPRGRSRKPEVKAPPPASLFDLTNEPPPIPMQVKSGASIDAAKEVKERTMTLRRRQVLHLLHVTKPGLARFQIAARLGYPDHWLSSTVAALIQMRKIEESKTLTIENPKSGKQCAVLVKIETAEDAAA